VPGGVAGAFDEIDRLVVVDLAGRQRHPEAGLGPV